MAAKDKAETERAMTERVALDQARRTLQVILTLATFAYGDQPAGHALDPEHVEDLCRKTLEKTKAAATEKRAAGRRGNRRGTSAGIMVGYVEVG